MKHTCESCGTPIEQLSGSGRPRRFCVVCRPVKYVRVDRARTCEVCGASFEANANAKFCSNRCRQQNRPRVSCSSCGGPTGWTAGRRESATCSACRRPPISPCEFCGESFKAVRRSAGGRTRFCSRRCARRAEIAGGTHALGIPALTEEQQAELKRVRAEKATRYRRAKLLGVEREPYTRDEIAERDGYVCWLCGEPVDMGLRHPHPRSASVDHFIPLSLGGDDTRANVYLAHLGENLARGSRWASCSLKLHPLATA